MPQTVVVLGARNLVGAIIDHFLALGETRPAWLGARKRSTAFAPPAPSRSKPTQAIPPPWPAQWNTLGENWSL
jgi:hypothetical protein